ncbi:hypothetical protein I546_1098 [Mycobacterium kansasii 732]|nr:hypothetical protein I546_1098 [Mycobacterium kansasii 732]
MQRGCGRQPGQPVVERTLQQRLDFLCRPLKYADDFGNGAGRWWC